MQKIAYLTAFILIPATAMAAPPEWLMNYSPYSNEITFVAASQTFTWDAPATNTDASVLTDLGGYSLECGPSTGNYTVAVELIGNILSYPISGWLTLGNTYYCAIRAFNTGIPATMRTWRTKHGSTGHGTGSTDNFVQ